MRSPSSSKMVTVRTEKGTPVAVPVNAPWSVALKSYSAAAQPSPPKALRRSSPTSLTPSRKSFRKSSIPSPRAVRPEGHPRRPHCQCRDRRAAPPGRRSSRRRSNDARRTARRRGGVIVLGRDFAPVGQQRSGETASGQIPDSGSSRAGSRLVRGERGDGVRVHRCCLLCVDQTNGERARCPSPP